MSLYPPQFHHGCRICSLLCLLSPPWMLFYLLLDLRCHSASKLCHRCHSASKLCLKPHRVSLQTTSFSPLSVLLTLLPSQTLLSSPLPPLSSWTSGFMGLHADYSSQWSVHALLQLILITG